MIRLVRTNRRDSGSALRSPGPWHIARLESDGLTWCGKRPGRLIASQHAKVDAPLPVGTSIADVEGLPEGSYCRPCQAALREGRSRPYRR